MTPQEPAAADAGSAKISITTPRSFVGVGRTAGVVRTRGLGGRKARPPGPRPSASLRSVFGCWAGTGAAVGRGRRLIGRGRPPDLDGHSPPLLPFCYEVWASATPLCQGSISPRSQARVPVSGAPRPRLLLGCSAGEGMAAGALIEEAAWEVGRVDPPLTAGCFFLSSL